MAVDARVITEYRIPASGRKVKPPAGVLKVDGKERIGYHLRTCAYPNKPWLLPRGCRQHSQEDVLGEFQLGLYLDVHVGMSDAETAAEGWGGDRYAVHWREDESAFVLVLRLAWDTPADAAEFFSAYTAFAQDRFGQGSARTEGETRQWWSGDDQLLLARNSQDETLIIIAPDAATLEAIHSLFPDF